MSVANEIDADVLSGRAWDATPRERVVTRGLLMGLSRRRAVFFTAAIHTELVTSILTLGLRPLWIAGVRVDRWRRYEWCLLEAFATWWHGRTHDAAARELAEDAARFAAPRSIDRPVSMAIVGAAVLLFVAFRDGGWRLAIDTAFRPQSLAPHAFAYSAVLSLAWLVVLARGWQQHARANLWIESLNAVLARDGRRPVPMTKTRVPWLGFGLAGILALVGPTWAATLVAVLAVQNEIARSFRPPRLAMVERMLERMDASGLPVEFDIDATEPDRFAAPGGL